MAEGQVEGTYQKLKEMAVGFRFRPGDRLNEGTLARELGVSRTPLREALNRLVAEKLFEFRPGTGFFCRGLEAQTVFDLFEMRQVLEMASARLACVRGSDEALAAIRSDLIARGLDVTGLTVAEACARDEAFHVAIARAGANDVLVSQLEQINERIRYLRWVSLSMGRLRKSKTEHLALADALVARNSTQAARIASNHVGKRMDQVIEVVRRGISEIYMDMDGDLATRILQEDAA